MIAGIITTLFITCVVAVIWACCIAAADADEKRRQERLKQRKQDFNELQEIDFTKWDNDDWKM